MTDWLDKAASQPIPGGKQEPKPNDFAGLSDTELAAKCREHIASMTMYPIGTLLTPAIKVLEACAERLEGRGPC